MSHIQDRRRFFKYLAASAVLTPAARALAQQISSMRDLPDLAAAEEALQAMDFEAVAKKTLPPAHWGYMATGTDDNRTRDANVEAFRHVGLKPRRLVDVSKPDTSMEVYGERWETPLFICPVGGQRTFNPQGELATARAAKAKRHKMILSNVTTYSLEEVSTALGAVPWQQLYLPTKWEDTVKLVKRIEDAGCPVLVWTIDVLAGRNTPTMSRYWRQDTRNCVSCHTGGPGVAIYRPMYEGLTLSYNPSDATWATFERLKRLTKMKVVLKGVETAEDAALALRYGADGVIVSNHGGRALETLRSTLDCLPEVVQTVKGRVPVFLDGGVRQGSDIYKALALGARGVGIGRPYIWGLSAFGQAGVERVLEIMRAELTLTMKQMGTPTIADIKADRLVKV